MNLFEEKIEERNQSEGVASLEGENCIEFLRGSKTATVTFTQGRYITKVRKLAKEYPEDVEICYDEQGIIIAHIPVRAVKLNLAKGRELTEEQREAARERLLRFRRKKEDGTANEERVDDDDNVSDNDEIEDVIYGEDIEDIEDSDYLTEDDFWLDE